MTKLLTKDGDLRTLEQRPDPMWSPFPKRTLPRSTRSKPSVSRPIMLYRKAQQHAMSSSDSSHGDHPVIPTVKTPEKGNGGDNKEVVVDENLSG